MTTTELKNEIKTQTITAMKAKDSFTVSVLRSMTSVLTNNEKSAKPESDAIKLLSSMAKQRKASITAYKDAGKNDMMNDEMKELEIIEQFLPKQMTSDELSVAVTEMMRGESNLQMKDMGRLVGKFSGLYPGQDMKTVSGLIRNEINN